VADQIAFAVRATEALHDRVLAAVGEATRTPYEIAFSLVDADANLDTIQSALSGVLCVLEHLERRGAVRSAGEDGVRHVRRRRLP
jgi:hypothetical protein